jgi:Transposase IS66 family
MLENFDPASIADEGLRAIVLLLMTEVERLSADNQALKQEVQRLRDENRRLKGEQGTPVIRPVTQPPSLSSEKERHVPRAHRKKTKRGQVRIDRQEVRYVDPQILPPDAEFKGYVEVVVQDVCFATDNVLFRKEKFYSPGEKRTYLADLPAGYGGEFGPGVHAWVLSLAYASGVSQPKIKDLLETVGLTISAGEISAMLIKHHEVFHQERQDILQAGVASTTWQHLDSTATRVYGQNYQCHVLCNPFYTAYCTMPRKDRVSLVCALLGRRTPLFVLNDVALGVLHAVGVPQKWVRAVVALLPWGTEITEERLTALLATAPTPLPWDIARMVRDALAISFYRTQTAVPVIPLLVVDDAAQFNLLTEELALCWVHEWRHYKKLEPRIAFHRWRLDRFAEAFWAFYRRLLAYREHPTDAESAALTAAFTALFTTPTCYAQLDHRAALTWAKKEHLLQVLRHPEVPLHNNPAELGARQRVRKRDVSLAARTEEGVAAWDTFQTLAETAKKLGVNITAYLRDRLTRRYALPSLASLIAQQSVSVAPSCAA